MKFLIDENMPPSFCLPLIALGFEAKHVYNVKLNNTPDIQIVDYAIEHDYIIVTNDLDFSRLIAIHQFKFPSVMTFRISKLNFQIFEEIINLNLAAFVEDLASGALVTIDDKSIRIQHLPIQK